MMDCSSAEIRDLLPAYAHGRLSAVERQAVGAHLAECAGCAAELALLRSAARALAAAPAIDVARIVAALPAPPRRVDADVIPIESRRPGRNGVRQRWSAPRRLTAIAATVVGVIGLSLATGRRSPDGQVGAPSGVAVSPVVVVPSGSADSPIPGGASVAPAGELVVATTSDAELSVAGGVSDLSDDALRALLGDIERLDDGNVVEPAEELPAVLDVDEEAGV